jgi:hypothetical protein
MKEKGKYSVNPRCGSHFAVPQSDPPLHDPDELTLSDRNRGAPVAPRG